MNPRKTTLKMTVLAMLSALGVVISPILRVEGMCPMAHFINIVCSVLLGPWYSLLCATLIGIIRMSLMGIPPLALTGAVFGAYLSGVLYRISGGKLLFAVIGEVVGTGIIGSLVSYPVMTLLWGTEGLSWIFYVPSFFCGSLIGGGIALIFLKKLAALGILKRFQNQLAGEGCADKQRIAALREKRPLIHCITNPISIYPCANAILAVGASPIMAEHPREVEQITATAGALVLNLGNITDVRMQSMVLSAQAARQHGVPMVLDAVGVACSQLRREFAMDLLSSHTPGIIKGNYSEILALYSLGYSSAGVDADASLTVENVSQAAAALAKTYGTTVLASGAVDIITDGKRMVKVKNGTPQLAAVTGTGCMLGALCGAYLAVSDGFAAAVTAAAVLGICGEKSQREKGSGTFLVNLLDSLSTVTEKTIKNHLQMEEYSLEKP